MAAPKIYPSKEIVCETFTYKDGELLWRIKAKRTVIGKRAGTNGLYWRVCIKGSIYAIHRLIWIYHYGDIPADKEIDHKNENKYDNRIENLRLSTRSQNKLNQCKKSGVNYNRVTNRYSAFITYNYDRMYIGTFQTRPEAEEAYQICKDVLFGEFLNS